MIRMNITTKKKTKVMKNIGGNGHITQPLIGKFDRGYGNLIFVKQFSAFGVRGKLKPRMTADASFKQDSPKPPDGCCSCIETPGDSQV